MTVQHDLYQTLPRLLTWLSKPCKHAALHLAKSLCIFTFLKIRHKYREQTNTERVKSVQDIQEVFFSLMCCRHQRGLQQVPFASHSFSGPFWLDYGSRVCLTTESEKILMNKRGFAVGKANGISITNTAGLYLTANDSFTAECNRVCA